MRIQFTVSQSEWNTLEMKSIKEGYPDVPSYCKDMVLKQRTYAMLWNTVTKKIESMPWGTLRKEGAPRLLYLKLKIVVLKRYSLSAMPFLLCCVPVLLNALGTLLPFLRD